MTSDGKAACGYIADGYTERGYIAEVERIHPAVRFTYRPLTYEQRRLAFERWDLLTAAEQVKRSTKIIASQVIEWDIRDHRGQTVDHTKPEQVRRLKMPLHERLVDVIACAVSSDPDPEDKTVESKTEPEWGGFLNKDDEGNSGSE